MIADGIMYCPNCGYGCPRTSVNDEAVCWSCPSCYGHYSYITTDNGAAYHLPDAGEPCPWCGQFIQWESPSLASHSWRGE